MIQGQKISHCSHCWSLEDQGLKSPREPKRFHYWMKNRGFIKQKDYDPKLMTENLSHISDINHPSLKSTRPTMVELILGNTCDLKCMYCSHHYSSQWAAERIKYGEISQQQYDIEFPKPLDLFQEKFWEWFKTARLSIYRLGIIGGEPLITPEFYPLLEKLIVNVKEISNYRKNKITLFFVTNLNTNEKYFTKFIEMLPILSETFKIEILISQESVGRKAEYIRNGLNWDRFDSNINRLFSMKHLDFDISFLPTINILSISSLPDIMKYIFDLYMKYNRPIGLRHNIVSDPSWQSPRLLTNDFSVYIDRAIEYIEQNNKTMPEVSELHGRLDGYVNFLETLKQSLNNSQTEIDNLRKKFVEWFNIYDQRRGLNLLETFPEYKNFYEMCEKI
jgi:sulfatase maturation enzyme AslB (radical SAM superfamily)